MSESQDLRTKAAHYRELARMLDQELAGMCCSLAEQYDADAEAADARPPPQIITAERK